MIDAAGLPKEGVLVGRAWNPDVDGPALCVLHDGALIDITTREAPTMRDLLEMDDPASYALERAANGTALGAFDATTAKRTGGGKEPFLLAPNDLQAVKACGVTFARSMIERVIEERAAGDPSKAAAIRERCQVIIGDSLRDLKAGSQKAEAVKGALIARLPPRTASAMRVAAVSSGISSGPSCAPMMLSIPAAASAATSSALSTRPFLNAIPFARMLCARTAPSASAVGISPKFIAPTRPSPREGCAGFR